MSSPSLEQVYPNPIFWSRFGINEINEAGYAVDLKVGSDEYRFDFFDGPVLLQDEHQCQSYDGNVFILHAPGQSQHFRAQGPLKHTWFQVSGDGVATCVKANKIPINKAAVIKHPDFLFPLLEEAQRQLSRKHPFWEDALTEIGRSLIRNLGRALYPQNSAEFSPIQKDLLVTLYKVRAEIYKDLKRRWTVDDMAALANMSVARFAIAYRSNFGTGPIDDLIDFRLRHAEILLRNLPIAIADVALQSGFNTASNFYVLFRERTGRSPKDLRKTNGRSISVITDLEIPFEESEAARKIYLLYIRPVAHWSFDNSHDEIIDNLRKHPAAILHNNATKVPGRLGGHALHFDGASHAVIPETIIDTSLSYSVSAWLKPDRAGRMTAVSIGNSRHGAFYLQYIAQEGGFKFAATRSDRDPWAFTIDSGQSTLDGEWRHAVGVHDAQRQEIRFYLDAELQGALPYTTAWRADGDTYFGGCRWRDSIIDPWTGSMDDIRIYDTALSNMEIEMLYKERAEAGMPETPGA